MKLLRTEADMVEAYRQRIRELNITFATVDAISGLPDGYTAKLMGPHPIKGLGEKAIEGLNGALGIGFAVTEDPEQIARVNGRWVKRKRAVDKKKRLSMTLSIEDYDVEIVRITPELQAKLTPRERMSMGGKRGGKRRLKMMGKRARQRIATHAARMRWARRDLPTAPVCD